CAADFLRAGQHVLQPLAGALTRQLLDRALRLAQLAEQRVNALGGALRFRAELRGDGLQGSQPLADHRLRGAPRHRFDAAHTRAAALLPRDQKLPDLAGGAHVRAAAQLVAPALGAVARLGDRHGADHLAVLLAEQRHRAFAARLGERLGDDLGGPVGEDHLVDLPGDGVKLRLADGLVVREVEAQPVGRDERALLPDVLAEHAAQCGVEQVRRGVVTHDIPAALLIDRALGPVANLDLAAHHLANVQDQASNRGAHRVDAYLPVPAAQHAGVADLAASLNVEGGLGQYDLDSLAFGRLEYALTLANERDDPALEPQPVVIVGLALHALAGQLARRLEIFECLLVDGHILALARLTAGDEPVPCHLPGEPRLADAGPLLAPDFAGGLPGPAVLPADRAG